MTKTKCQPAQKATSAKVYQSDLDRIQLFRRPLKLKNQADVIQFALDVLAPKVARIQLRTAKRVA